MIYTPMTKKAMCLAYSAHHGQLDKSGMPYILHPVHLAEQMTDEVTCTVALLHDTVEDTAVTLADLAKIFPAEVVEAVALLTHPEGMDYFEYVRRIKENPVARTVKLADLAHNSDASRLAGCDVDPVKVEARREKYRRAVEILTQED